MDTKENKEEEFQKGFNEGYLLAKHNFTLADKIADALRDSERGVGFKDVRNSAKKKKSQKLIYRPGLKE